MSDQIFPEPTVGAFIFNAKGELLLIESHKWPGRYVVPGGHVDIEFINFQQFIYDPAFWKKRHFIFFDFACKTDSTSVQLNDEAEGFVWVEPRQALTLELDTYTRRSVEEWLKNR
jgi:nucleoside triphosphatase